MSPNDDARKDPELDRMADRDERIAREARNEAERSREAPYARPDRAPDPMIDRGDEIRAESDARTQERQASLAESEGRAAGDLQASGEAIRDASEGFDRTHERVAEGKHEVERLADSARDLREQTRRLLDDVRKSKPRIVATTADAPQSPSIEPNRD